MNPETLPLLGAILIVASATLAFVAFLLARRRRSEGEEAEKAEEVAPEVTVERELPQAPRPAATVAPAPAERIPSPADRMIPVATLLRDEVTGDLVVRVGDRDYRAAAELLVSRDRQRIEYTLSELNRWFSLSPSREAARQAEKPGAPEVGRRPLSMVEQINKILERRLTALPESRRAVRLVEGTGGSVRVYVGVNGYSAIDEVPDEDIRRMIREAVAEWEAGQ
ncbi:MAG: hypothetical protein AB1449_05700 [Chloroflexota bacterium]